MLCMDFKMVLYQPKLIFEFCALDSVFELDGLRQRFLECEGGQRAPERQSGAAVAEKCLARRHDQKGARAGPQAAPCSVYPFSELGTGHLPVSLPLGLMFSSLSGHV